MTSSLSKINSNSNSISASNSNSELVMDFNQSKLTKTEWESMEKKVDHKELTILKMIHDGLTNPEQDFRLYFTASQIFKLEHPDKDYHIYMVVFKDLLKKHDMETTDIPKPKKPLNSADTIRLKSMVKKVDESVEMVLIDMVLKFKKSKKSKELYYYNIDYLTRLYPINQWIKKWLTQFLEKNEKEMSVKTFLENTNKYIENNDIFKFKPLELYDHQKQVYSIMSGPGNKLVFYRAPTSSGKTLTPLGISQKYKVLFICASRHIGVSLAKSAVNASVKVGFAFGCSTSDDVRLHYSSVRTFTEKYGKKRPVHSDGRNVELMICDIQSYEVAMLYMLSFFETSNVVLFWDEPTITMDYEEHDLHAAITKLWTVNKIPNIVLSSATLPNQSDLKELCDKYTMKYEGEVFYVESIDETTHITLLDTAGQIVMPHKVFSEEFDGILQFIDKHGLSHMKFLSLTECSEFILFFAKKYPNLKQMIKQEYSKITEVNSQNLRMLYYKVIRTLPSWVEDIQDYLKVHVVPPLNVTNLLVTESSHTLTHGPTIYLCEDTRHWIDFFVKNSGIHESTLTELEKKLESNQVILEKIFRIRKDIEDKTAKDEGNENKMKEQRFDSATKALIQEADTLEKMLKPVQLHPSYIPNSREHFDKWTKDLNFSTSGAFSSHLDESYVKKIMNLEVDISYKILILMGVGVFNPQASDYNDLMKELSEQKKLGVILASSDFIYGTNYQFCHAYIAEDLCKMTQEKIIQAIGRVGRKEQNKTFTFRFRDDKLIRSLFVQENTMECRQMNTLFI